MNLLDLMKIIPSIGDEEMDIELVDANDTTRTFNISGVEQISILHWGSGCWRTVVGLLCNSIPQYGDGVENRVSIHKKTKTTWKKRLFGEKMIEEESYEIWLNGETIFTVDDELEAIKIEKRIKDALR